MGSLKAFAAASLAAGFGPAHAQTEVDARDIVAQLREDPVVCSAPDDQGSCEAISVTVLATSTRGIETSTSAFSVEPGIYLVMATSSNFDVGSDGFCYPNITNDIMSSQLFLTDSLDSASSDVQPIPPEGRAFVESMMLTPLVNLIDGGRICVRHFIPAERSRSDIYLVRTYIDGEQFEEDALVRFYPMESLEGLNLRPLE